MRKLVASVVLLALTVATAAPAAAKVINVEFKFTPYTGDPARSDKVTSVPGVARVFVNGIPVAEQPIEKREVPVLFEKREVAPAVWLPVASLGQLLRKGANTIRIEFVPTDARAKYNAELRWASVTDQTTSTGNSSHGTSTNQADEGVETKAGAARLVFEKPFRADFAADQKWHHYPAVAAVSDADRKDLTALVGARLETFHPDFAGMYALLKADPNVRVEEIRKARCIDSAYQAGVRVRAAEIDVTTTGGPAVVVRGKKGPLFAPVEPGKVDKLKSDDAKMCAGMALQIAYPLQLIAVRGPDGKWQTVP